MDVKWIEDIIEAALGRNDFENVCLDVLIS
jgi:hypothetical protein